MKLKNAKFLFLYRSFLFRFVNFKTDNVDLKLIVNALNIKKRKKKIEYIYDESVKIINKYYSKDLCQFKNNQCIAQRKYKSSSINGCCKMCTLVTDKGCPSSNLSCKLIYCKTALGNLKKLKMKDIPLLKCLSLKERIILKGAYFETRQEVINDIYFGIIIFGIKTVIKEIKRDIKMRKLIKKD